MEKEKKDADFGLDGDALASVAGGKDKNNKKNTEDKQTKKGSLVSKAKKTETSSDSFADMARKLAEHENRSLFF